MGFKSTVAAVSISVLIAGINIVIVFVFAKELFEYLRFALSIRSIIISQLLSHSLKYILQTYFVSLSKY